MARDRLAALRAQQQLSGNQASAPSTDNYELRNVDANAAGNDEMTAFYSEIQKLQEKLETYRKNVSEISKLHSRSMSNTNTESIEQDRVALSNLVDSTHSLSNDIKRRLEALQKERRTGTEGQIRNQQLAVISNKFLEAIQGYQQMEQQHRVEYRQRAERQLKIVKPDATPEEIKVFVEEGNGQQIFAQALQSTTRYGEARTAYQEVQQRQADIQKIEYTLSELAQLFNEMSILIAKEEEVINGIEQGAIDAANNTELGLKHTERAVKSARSARRKRWICFFITLIILAILGIALGVGLGIGLSNSKKNNNNSGGNNP